jgi:hypothetical protein
MGWKTSCILASRREGGRLVDHAQHDPDLADRVAAMLPRDLVFIGPSTFDAGLYPRDGHLYIGAYADTLLISDNELCDSCFEDNVPPVIATIDSILPKCTILALQLHSVVNLYAYALFRNGERLRARAGSGDDGVFLDVGEPLTEEIPLFARAKTNAAGEQVWLEEFDGDVEELDHSSMGEEFVFEVSRRLFGERFDYVEHDKLPMSEYKTPTRTLWERLFGRRP